MTFQDERTQASRDGKRVEQIAEWLEMTLGPRLTAYAVGVSPSEIARFAHGEAPTSEVEQRLRYLYTATWFIASTDGPGSAHDWLCEPNPTLENRSPVDLLRAGEPPAPQWFSVARVY